MDSVIPSCPLYNHILFDPAIPLVVLSAAVIFCLVVTLILIRRPRRTISVALRNEYERINNIIQHEIMDQNRQNFCIGMLRIFCLVALLECQASVLVETMQTNAVNFQLEPRRLPWGRLPPTNHEQGEQELNNLKNCLLLIFRVCVVGRQPSRRSINLAIERIQEVRRSLVTFRANANLSHPYAFLFELLSHTEGSLEVFRAPNGNAFFDGIIMGYITRRGARGIIEDFGNAVLFLANFVAIVVPIVAA